MALALGQMKRAPGFRIVRGKRVRIEGAPVGTSAGEPVRGEPVRREPVQGDGDSIAMLPIDIALTDKSLRLVVP